MDDFKVEVLGGRLFVNGIEVEDFIDRDGKRYRMAVSKPTPVLERAVNLAFRAGRRVEVSGRHEELAIVRMPLVEMGA